MLVKPRAFPHQQVAIRLVRPSVLPRHFYGYRCAPAGVKIGTVTDMALNPETYRAEVTFAIQEGIEIPDDSTFAIESEGLLGGQYVEVVPGSFDYLVDGDEALDTQGAVA